MDVQGEESDGGRGDEADDEGAAEWRKHAWERFFPRSVDVAELWTVDFVMTFLCLMLSYYFMFGCVYVLSVYN